ncbi:MAG: hypothetical protein GYA24_03825 [Candidatus Lokiarchaeota archaeon]|nr:hypothetical protein [Candidatus Lokiarchaeota archaeon]
MVCLLAIAGSSFTTGVQFSSNQVMHASGTIKSSRISPSSLSFNNTWYKLWSYAGSDIAHAIGNDSTGNLYIAGQSSGNIFIAKYNVARNVVWNKTRVSSSTDDIMGMSVDGNGNIYIAGTRNFGGGDLSAYLAKYDTNGVSQWNRTWHKLSAASGYGVAADRFGNVFIAGDFTDDWFHVDAFLAKYNSAGTCLWNKTWDKNVYDGARAVAVDSSGAICITGTSGDSAFVSKYDVTGTSLWNRTCAASIGSDEGMAVTFDPSGAVYVSGYTNGPGGIDAFISKYSAGGTSQWNRTWGGANDERGYGICADTTGAFLVGFTNSLDASNTDAFINKYGLNGNLVCSTTCGGGFNDEAWSVISDGAGGVYITGRTGGFGATERVQAFLARFIISESGDPGPAPFPVEYLVIILASAGAAVAIVAIVFVKRRSKGKKGR